MQFLYGMDMLTLTLIISIGLLCMIAVFCWAQRHFELALIMILLSPWIHFLFEENIPQTPEDVLSTAGSIGPSTYIRLSIVLFAGSVGALRFFRSRSSGDEKIPTVFGILGVFILYALLSTGYSIDQSFTFVRSFEFIAFFGFLLGLFFWMKDRARMDGAIGIFFFVVVIGAFINLCTLLAFPAHAWWWQAPDRFQGFMAHPNTLGAFCMVSYPILLWEYARRGIAGRSFIVILAIALFIMHILSGSRTTLAISLFGFAIWQVILSRKAIFVLVVAAIIFGGYFLVQSQLPSFERYESKRITHLTGRTQFWAGSIALAMEKPILGYGYAVEGKIWEDPRFQSDKSNLWMGSARSSIHNGYLSVIIGLGIMGFILWLAAIVPPIWRVCSVSGDIYKAVLLVMLVQLLLTNIFESVVTTSRTLESITFWMFWVFAIKHLRFMTREVQ